MKLYYWSSKTAFTHRFMEKLTTPNLRLPLTPAEDTILATEPFVLVTPTYGDGEENAVPLPVRKFLEAGNNSQLIRGVIASGNRNFGEHFGLAGKVISKRFGIPTLYRFELAGMPSDVSNVDLGLERFWRTQL